MPQTVEQTTTPLRLIESFSEHCREIGWICGEFSDFVKYENKYYCFVWIRSSYQRNILEILTDSRCSILENGEYCVRKYDYKALIFPEPPPSSLIRALVRNLELAKRFAIYDISSLNNRKSIVKRFNETETPVYQAFEDFLQRTYRVTFVPLESL